MSWDSDTKENDVCKSTWEQLKSFRVNHKKQMIFGHLNINGLRKKFFEFKDMLADSVIDNVFLSENKLDESFPTPQFNVNGFSHHRNDRNGHGGGLAAHSRSDIPHRRRTDYESKANDGVEFIIFDVIIRHGKWLFIGVYKPPSVHDDHLIESMTNVFRQTQGAYRSTFVIGDINIDMLKAPKQFKDFMHLWSWKCHNWAYLFQGQKCNAARCCTNWHTSSHRRDYKLWYWHEWFSQHHLCQYQAICS